MAVRVQIDLDRLGILREALTSSAVQDAIMEKAEEIADNARNAGIMVEGDPGDVALPIEVVDARSSSRARALVVIDHPSGVAVESKHRLLGGALG